MDWTFWTTIWGAVLEEKRELQLLPILFFFIRIFQILTRKNVRGVRAAAGQGGAEQTTDGWYGNKEMGWTMPKRILFDIIFKNCPCGCIWDDGYI